MERIIPNHSDSDALEALLALYAAGRNEEAERMVERILSESHGQ